MKYTVLISLLISLFSVFSVFASEYTLLSKEDSAKFLAERGVIKTTEDFQVNNFISRGEILKVIGKLSGETIPNKCTGAFQDVSQKSWQCKYIEWALSKGYIAQNTTFRPNDSITKTEAVKLLLKVRGIQKVQKTDSWQEDYMQTAYEYGLIDTKYSDYNAPATRGWIFRIATASIQKLQEIREQQKERLMSDETL